MRVSRPERVRRAEPPRRDDDHMAGSAGVPVTDAAACCSARPAGRPVDLVALPARGSRRHPATLRAPVPTLLALRAGEFAMGSGEHRYPADGEGPPHDRHRRRLPDRSHAVTNDDFACFVAATG